MANLLPAAVRDLQNFQYRAAAYVRAKGRLGPDAEDLVSEMLVVALEHPEGALSLDIAYLRALDKVDPRHQVAGERRRDTARHVALDSLPALRSRQPLPDAAPVASRGMEALPAPSRLRACLLLHGMYGYTMREIGFLFGVTESRVSQLLSAARRQDGAARQAAQARGEWDLQVEVGQWLTL